MTEDGQIRVEEPSRRALPLWLTETPYWAVSAVVHLILLLLIGGFVLSRQIIEPTPTKVIISREFKRPPYDPTLERKPERKPPVLDPQNDPVVSKLPELVPPTKPKGNPDRHSDRELRENSVADAFAMCGAAASIYGDRDATTRPQGRGGPGSESAVLAALWWLVRHQHPDGHWSSHEFYQGNATDPESYRDERYGFTGFDVGVTSLALLAFLGDGHTHRSSVEPEFRRTVERGMKWLLKQQLRDASKPQLHGAIGYVADREEWIYNHAIATMALSELLYMSRDRMNLIRPVERATRYCMRAQNDDYGWKYEYRGGKNDSSVTGWMVLALKAAKTCTDARLTPKIRPDEYAPHIAGAMNWFDRATSAKQGKTGYEGPGDDGSSLHGVYPEPYPYSKRASCMTAVALLCRLFANQSIKSERVRDAVTVLMRELPEWRPARGKLKSKINIYHWYYASYALFQYGGPKWRKWSDAMLEAMLPTQIVSGDKDGSWDPIGEWGAAGGRVYSTALGAMTLEVYYRYRRTAGDEISSR